MRRPRPSPASHRRSSRGGASFDMTGKDAAAKLSMHPDTFRYHVKRLQVGVVYQRQPPSPPGIVYEFSDSDVDRIREFSIVPAGMVTITGAVTALGVSHSDVYKWAKTVGIQPRPAPYSPPFLFSAEDIERIRVARRDNPGRLSVENATHCNRVKPWLRRTTTEKLESGRRLNAASMRARARRSDWADADLLDECWFAILPTIVSDPELSSQIAGGPKFATWQWHRNSFLRGDDVA